MSEEQDAKPVKIDPKCIQEAMRMYFQPIKHDDPQVDFYTMYKRESMEYDTEYIQKYNEDLNTTLIFAGLFSAVSSAFVIDVQSGLQPDPAECFEAYLRAILLSLNRSIVPGEDPAAPPVWNGPPTEIVATSNLLYASLLMSLLAAFVAMLGKQWLNRYLRHTGGSTVERCGDRQRKFDGLKKWPFHLFIESLPVILQIALLLLTCGLSQYMWSINVSVASVVISFTVLGILFYVGIVVAGTSSYECPLQTPASIALRSLRDNEKTQRLLTSLSPLKTVSFLCIVWMGAREFFPSGVRRARNAVMNGSSRDISLSSIVSGIRGAGQKVGHRIIILLLRVDRALGNVKQRIIQTIRRSKRAMLLPTATIDIQDQLRTSRAGLRVPVQNLENLRRLNADSARCVSWILRNITDPEAIDSAIRLAGTIRWFDGDLDIDPPFDVIVSTFEACFGLGERLYSGMEERAYLSGRAILHINTRARRRSHECASDYPIPTINQILVYATHGDLQLVIYMLRAMGPSGADAVPSIDLLGGTDPLWISNLFVDLAQVYRSPSPVILDFFNTVRTVDYRIVGANLLAWYILLGGHVEEETFWRADESILLNGILPRLSARVVELIPDSKHLPHLRALLDFLEAWEEQYVGLHSMTYDWCSAISEKLRGLERGRTALEDRLLQRRPDSCHPRGETADDYADLLLTALELGFRRDKYRGFHLAHTSHHLWMLDIILSSHDEIIADAIRAFAAKCNPEGTSTRLRHLSGRVERGTPFSLGLRLVAIDFLRSAPMVAGSELEVARLLNRLNLDVDDMGEECWFRWQRLFVPVIRSPTGWEVLSSHNWRLLGKSASALRPHRMFSLCDVDIEIAMSLEAAEDREKLEVWILVIWSSFGLNCGARTEDFIRVTTSLFQRRQSALRRFESLYEQGLFVQGDRFRRM